MYFEMYQDSSGEWRWRLRSANNKIIATSSEGYSAKSDCSNGIALVKSVPFDTEVKILDPQD